MSIKLLTEQHLKFLSLKGGCTGLSKCHIVGNHMWLIADQCSHKYYEVLHNDTLHIEELTNTIGLLNDLIFIYKSA